MLFKGCHHPQIALHSSGVVIADVTLDHLNQLLLTGKSLSVIAFTFQDTPETFHGAVVNTVRHTRHALSHPGLYQLPVEPSASVLETSIAMKQGMGIRICFHRLIKCFVNKRVIITLAQHIGNDSPVAKVEDSTQIKFVCLKSLIPLKLRYIGKPFLIRSCGVELAVQKVLSNILRVLGLPGTAMAVVFYGGPDIPGATDTQHSLVIYMDAIVVAQIIIEPSVSFIRTLLVDLFDLVGQTLIFHSSAAQLPRNPFMVGGASHMESFTGRFNGKPLRLVAFFDGDVDMALSYFRKASLLSTSSNFFSRAFSISARYSLCLSCSISICACSSSVRGA